MENTNINTIDLPEKMYLYTTISSNISQSQINTPEKYLGWIKSSLAYKLLIAQTHDIFFAPELEIIRDKKHIDEDATVVIDIISGYQRKNCTNKKKRPRLQLILDEAVDTYINLVTFDISQLGDTADEIRDFYNECKNRKITITIYDSTQKNNINEFSTALLGGEVLSTTDVGAVYEKLYSLTNNNLHSLQGKNNKEFSSAFVDALFLYESYRIPEDIAYLMSGFSINAFHYKAVQFETCNRNIFIEYSFDDSSPVQPYCYGDLQQEWFQRHRINNISLLPKRYGNVPDNFELLQNAVSQYINIHGHNDIQIFLRDTCVDFGIPFMTYIDYCRYCAKADIGSKKEIYQLYKDYYDMNLIAAFNQYKNDVDSHFSSIKDRREQYANFIYTE